MEHKQNVRLLLRQWRVIGLVLAGVLLVGLAIPLAGAAPAHQATGIIRIGYLGEADNETANGALLAIRQINESGGVTGPDGTIYQFELVALEDEPTVDDFAAAVATLMAQNVTVLLGPDDNALITPETIQSLIETEIPTLTAATGDALTDVDTVNLIFRIRAPERIFSYAIGTYLAEDLELQSIAVIQTEVEFTEALMGFETTLNSAGVTVSDRIQLPGGETLTDQVERLINLAPQAIVMWGAYTDAAELLEELRNQGWDGIFAYRFADEAARAGILSDKLAEGTLGMNSWSYSIPADASKIFVRDYAVAYAEVPGPMAVAGYDAMWFLRGVVRAQGADPELIRMGLLESGPQTLVQGVLHPLEFGNGDLSRNAVVYELGKRGGPVVVARFDDTSRFGPGGPTPPTPTPAPQVTPLPTATLEGVWVRVIANVLNVRTGPGFDYDRVGQAEAGDLYRVLGTIPDYSWMLIDFQGGVGWIKTEFVEVLGDLGSISIITPPPTPTIGMTATPSLPPNPELLIDTVVLNPSNPVPGQPFTATVTVRNAGGGAAGRFAVAATWLPGDVYTSSFVEGLAGGQTTQVSLGGTLTGTGVFQVGVVVDLNKEVAELDENNNVYNISYRVDHPIFKTESGIQVPKDGPDNTLALDPGKDFLWDGANIGMLNGAQIAVLSGVTYENVHYDMLAPGVVTYESDAIGSDRIGVGSVYAFITSEGRRAVLRIDNVQTPCCGPLWVTYRTYEN